MANKETTKSENKKTKSRQGDYPNTIEVMVNGMAMIAMFKEFSTGSLGYNVSGKVVIEGKKAQVSGNIIIIKSKPGDDNDNS